MKLRTTDYQTTDHGLPVRSLGVTLAARFLPRAQASPEFHRRSVLAFTMIEIAICLAVIGFALAAIVGVLPLGMNVQRENREETIINQDASVFLNAIRNGEL